MDREKSLCLSKIKMTLILCFLEWFGVSCSSILSCRIGKEPGRKPMQVKCHRIHRMVGVGRDLWASPNPTPPAKAGSPRAGCTGPHPGGFWISPEKETCVQMPFSSVPNHCSWLVLLVSFPSSQVDVRLQSFHSNNCGTLLKGEAISYALSLLVSPSIFSSEGERSHLQPSRCQCVTEQALPFFPCGRMSRSQEER